MFPRSLGTRDLKPRASASLQVGRYGAREFQMNEGAQKEQETLFFYA